MKDEVLKLALDALDNLLYWDNGKSDYDQAREAITAIKQALAAPVQEPVAWKWHQAPVKTQWGDDMVVADLAIGKDHTVSIYCERDQTVKVEAMFNPPAAPVPCCGQYETCTQACTPRGEFLAKREAQAAQPAPVQEPITWLKTIETLGGFGKFVEAKPNEKGAKPVYLTPPAAPVQDLPFGVGGGLVAIKTLLSRDPCVHANTAIEMIDAILKEHPAAQPAPVQPVGTYGEIYESMQALLRSGLQRDQQIYMEMKDKPLYTTPPAAQRQWAGLTETEVDECYESVMFNPDIEPTRVLVYQAIQAKLKEKNNG